MPSMRKLNKINHALHIKKQKRTEYMNKKSRLIAFLNKAVIGQDHACKAVGTIVSARESGKRMPNKPLGSFLLMGPTGTGKTALVQAVSRYLYPNDSCRMATINMADFQLQESIAVLLGRNKDEQGRLGDIIDALNEQGGGILLFDEIEKAHKELCTTLLAVLDTGIIHMTNGVEKSLKNIYLFFTSNLGSGKIAQLNHSTQWLFNRIVTKAAEAFFRQEGYVRFQTPIIFHALSFETQRAILIKMLHEHCALTEDQLQIKLEIDEASVIPFLVRNGFHPTLGARPLQNAIDYFFNEALTDLPDDISAKTYNIQANDHRLIAIAH